MPMTKRDYEAIAAQFRAMRNNTITYREKTLLSELASRLASYFRSNNLAFDTGRFLQATGAYDERVPTP